MRIVRWVLEISEPGRVPSSWERNRKLTPIAKYPKPAPKRTLSISKIAKMNIKEIEITDME